jgi:hypothetical protein
MLLHAASSALLGSVLGNFLRLSGKLCLHASVIKADERAIAFLGATGAGKSTLAAACTRNDCPILADDLAVLIPEKTTFYAQSGYPRLRLWPESLGILQHPVDELSRIFPDLEKRFWDLSTDDQDVWRQFHPTPLPLGGIYILSPRDPALLRATLEPLSPANGLKWLVEHRYGLITPPKKQRIAEFTQLGHLTNQIPLRRLKIPDRLDRLPAVVTTVLADATALR